MAKSQEKSSCILLVCLVILGTSTPAFGQAPAGMQMPFGSPGTPGFGAMGASPFGKATNDFHTFKNNII